MKNNKTIFVTGATGNQGGATARNLAEKGFNVKALVRNASQNKIQKLKHPNIEIVAGDLDNPESYSHHLENIDGAFALFTFIYGVKKEVRQGLSFLEACKQKNVPFILYSSVIGADSGSNIPHWESKNAIETALRNSGIAFTIVRPASFYENYLIPDVRKRIVKGSLVTPVHKEKIQQFIGTEDVGKICAHIFMNSDKYLNKTITIGAEEMTLETAANTFSEALGKPVKYSKLPAPLTFVFMGSDLYKMFSYINTHDVRFVENLQLVRSEFPFLTTLSAWIKKNISQFQS